MNVQTKLSMNHNNLNKKIQFKNKYVLSLIMIARTNIMRNQPSNKNKKN